VTSETPTPAATTTRLAPSPTGAMHLGNARTFVINALLARRHGWRTLMRVEDLDGPRVKPGATEQILDELRWLGLEWTGPTVYQSARAGEYAAALDRLIEGGMAYPCVCSRKDVQEAASAPHRKGRAAVYPGTCRGRYSSVADAARRAGRPVAWRVRVDDAPIEVADRFRGPATFRLAETAGDFVIFKNEGLAGYQLAVVVDDAAAGVDAIVRGDDLLESAARQIHLRRLLGLDPHPQYWHLPLVVGPDGRRLAKRHGDTRLAHYRQRGTPADRILGLIAYWSGLCDRRRETSFAELLALFDPSLLPKTPVVFDPADDDFLLGR